MRNMTKSTTRRLLVVSAMIIAGTSAQAQSWDGFYAGGVVGAVDMTVEDLSYGSGPINPSGVSFGGFAGYNFQNGNFVFGVEALVESGDVSGTDSYMDPFTRGASGSLRGRVGFVAGDALAFVAVGATASEFTADHDGNGLAADIVTITATGVSYGIGVDYAVNDRGFLRVELNATNYADDVLPFYGAADNHDLAASSQTLYVGYGINF